MNFKSYKSKYNYSYDSISIMMKVILNTRYSKEEGRLHQGEPQVQRLLQNILLWEWSSWACSDPSRPRQTLHVSDMWRALPLSANPHWTQGSVLQRYLFQHDILRFICREQIQSVDSLTGITRQPFVCFYLVWLFLLLLSFDPETSWAALNLDLKTC